MPLSLFLLLLLLLLLLFLLLLLMRMLLLVVGGWWCCLWCHHCCEILYLEVSVIELSEVKWSPPRKRTNISESVLVLAFIFAISKRVLVLKWHSSLPVRILLFVALPGPDRGFHSSVFCCGIKAGARGGGAQEGPLPGWLWLASRMEVRSLPGIPSRWVSNENRRPSAIIDFWCGTDNCKIKWRIDDNELQSSLMYVMPYTSRIKSRIDDRLLYTWSIEFDVYSNDESKIEPRIDENRVWYGTENRQNQIEFDVGDTLQKQNQMENRWESTLIRHLMMAKSIGESTTIEFDTVPIDAQSNIEDRRQSTKSSFVYTIPCKMRNRTENRRQSSFLRCRSAHDQVSMISDLAMTPKLSTRKNRGMLSVMKAKRKHARYDVSKFCWPVVGRSCPTQNLVRASPFDTSNRYNRFPTWWSRMFSSRKAPLCVMIYLMLPGGSRVQNLLDRGHLSWVGSVLYRYWTTSHNGGLGCTADDPGPTCQPLHRWRFRGTKWLGT